MTGLLPNGFSSIEDTVTQTNALYKNGYSKQSFWYILARLLLNYINKRSTEEKLLHQTTVRVITHSSLGREMKANCITK